MGTHTRKLATVPALLLVCACHADGMGEHGCALDYSSGWGSYGLAVEHEEPTRCPVFIPEPGTVLETGATIVDGGVRNFIESRVLVQDANGAGVVAETAIFGLDRYNRWIAASYVYFPAGRAALRPDDVYYDLTFNGGSPGPSAHMKISYTDAVVTSISGPGFVEPGKSYTWSASISRGVGPYKYKWYRNWNLVGTGASYTGGGGGDTTYLRVDVIDSRGEVDSDGHRVIPMTCGTQRFC